MLKMDRLRPYVCLAMNNFTRATYPLRRIDALGLFHPTNQEKVTTMTPAEAEPVEHPLPPPFFTFSRSPSGCGWASLDFLGFFGLGQKKTTLAAVDYYGICQLYDIDDCIISTITPPQEKCFEPVSVALGDALYVMNKQLIPGRQSCFEVLTFGAHKPHLAHIPCWHWRSLQPPPFVFEPGYEATNIGAYTVAGDSSILISMPHIGTYSFDTVSNSWDKAGDWELPFHGRVDFFPEYGAWLGFSAQDNRLCYSSGLGASMQRQPVLDTVWDDPNPQLVLDDPSQHKYTRILKSQLVHLGCREFCVVKLYETVQNEYTEYGNVPQFETFIVLTGLVLKPSESGSGIEMIQHKSQLYKIEGVANCWIF